jgi:hypothetical protein
MLEPISKLIYEVSLIAKERFLLPKGEGQDQGKGKFLFAFKNLTPSP